MKFKILFESASKVQNAKLFFNFICKPSSLIKFNVYCKFAGICRCKRTSKRWPVFRWSWIFPHRLPVAGCAWMSMMQIIDLKIELEQIFTACFSKHRAWTNLFLQFRTHSCCTINSFVIVKIFISANHFVHFEHAE